MAFLQLRKMLLVASVALTAFSLSAALTIGTTDDPKASEIDFGNDLYCVVFSNGNATAWTFTPAAPLRVEKLLVVGGGGSGGCDCGAGGGGGAVLYTNYTTLAAAERPVINSEMTFTVGMGGVAAVSASRSGKLGGASEITLGGVTFKAYGGGGGGHWNGPGTLAAVEGEIASGGGKGRGDFANYRTDGKGYNSRYGNYGGLNSGAEYGGGGGGAGGVGEDATVATGARGGIGVTNDITGVAHLYGTGGCSGRGTVLPIPYEGGGSRASGYSIKGTDGLGGGGGGSYSGNNDSGAGGCGTVILVVTLLNDGKISAQVNDAFVKEDGAEHRCSVTVYTKNVTAKWGTSAEGPFELDEAPGFTEQGVHSCWCQLTAAGRETIVLKGTVYICGAVQSLDIGVTADSGAIQYSFGDGLYTIGFTNIAAGSVVVTPINNLRIERMLVVGGGGSGGNNCGAGGGGGGVIYGDYLLVPEAARPVITNAFTLSVGAGAPTQPVNGSGYQGSASTLTVEGTTFTAYGGGGGGAYTSVPRPAAVENEIGSGGGASYKGGGDRAVNGKGYNSAQGNMGGANSGGVAAGGGGAGEVGGDATSTTGGRGGAGFACSITGEEHLYGSGGGGGNANTIPTPPEGGGRGGNASVAVTGGTNGLGGGGGGSKGGTGDWPSGTGGSGCVYLLVKVIEGTTVSATLSDYFGSTDGEAHSNDLRVATAGASVAWSLTGAEGPFNLDAQPTFNTPGVYTNWCRVTATGKEPKTLCGVVMLRAAAGDYFVSTEGNDFSGLGTATLPYATVGKAVSEVRCGNTVRIAAGTYAESGLVLDKPVRLVGDAADRTLIVLDAEKIARTLTLSHAEAYVSGLTLKDGYATGGGNVYMTAGVMTNCVLTGGNGNASLDGGNANVSGGVLVDCELKNGLSARRGGGASLAGNGRAIRCYVHGNSVTDSGGGLAIKGNAVAENCFVTGNTAQYGGGVQLDSMGAWLVNCTVAGNSGGYNGVWHETNGGNTLNCVVYNGFYIKKGSIQYCGLSVTPTIQSGATPTIANNVTITADVFENTTEYRPKKGSLLYGKGSNAGYYAHAISATDYEGNPRRQSARIDIGHFELPPSVGTLIRLR